MNMKKLKSEWISENKNWINNHSDDKVIINMAWTEYVDSLCKDGQITLNQWNRLTHIVK